MTRILPATLRLAFRSVLSQSISHEWLTKSGCSEVRNGLQHGKVQTSDLPTSYKSANTTIVYLWNRSIPQTESNNWNNFRCLINSKMVYLYLQNISIPSFTSRRSDVYWQVSLRIIFGLRIRRTAQKVACAAQGDPSRLDAANIDIMKSWNHDITFI